MEIIDNILINWKKLYGDKYDEEYDRLISFLEATKGNYPDSICDNPLWYKDAIVYALYVDLFSMNFEELSKNLDYLKEFGVNTLWLFPILDSPLKDQGFDIRNYYKIRNDLGGNMDFLNFIKLLHLNDIKVIFDIAVNHTSSEHFWFEESKKGKNNRYRNYYFWSKDNKKFKDARIIFKGIQDSNWTYDEKTEEYYFHRFYDFQPDLNYQNPEVLIEMIKILVYWKTQGVDGFRMDAVPFIWKKENTNCENLNEAHFILKIFRASLDYINPGTVLIAEANIEPKKVVEYFGEGDECHIAYHFPIMPRFYLSIAEANYNYIKNTMSHLITPKIPDDCQWMSFLRCHDELTLEFVSADERRRMNDYFLKDPMWSFREGEGISGRLNTLMGENHEKVLLLFSMLLSIEGSPVIYYGDEVGMINDLDFYYKRTNEIGKKDSRFLNRGYMNWEKVHAALNNKDTKEYKIYNGLKKLINIRKQFSYLFYQELIIEPAANTHIFSMIRMGEKNNLIIVHNLSDKSEKIKINFKGIDLITDEYVFYELNLKPFDYRWIISDKWKI